MKNDIRKLEKITDEMAINDLLYEELSKEYCSIVRKAKDLPPCKIVDLIESLYFPRRVLSLLSNQDLPFSCAIGLYGTKDVLFCLMEEKEDFIGDSDTDTDIMTLLLEYGYRAFDELSHGYYTPEEMYTKVRLFKEE